MNTSEKEYLKSLIPENLTNWKDLLEEGIRAGKEIQVNPSRYMRDHGYENEVDLRMDRAAKGEITWRTIMGLASLEEQLEGLNYLYEFGEKNETPIDVCMIIPNMLTGSPAEFRENVPKGTSFVLENPKDWQDIADCPIHPAFCDFHMGSPNAFYNTINAVKAGSTYHGIFSQIGWDYPGCEDDNKWMGENIKALGVIAAKHDDKMVVDTYMDDGAPSYFFDLCSFLGYARLEKYIVSDLCGARYACSFGQLLDKMIPKMALWLALSDELKEEDQPGVSFFYSNCIDHWDHDPEANYGFLMSEVLMTALVERKYKTGVSILPIPITEKIAVPTPQAIANIHAAARKAVATADEWEEIVDFRAIEKIRDQIKETGMEFYHNILAGLEDAGIDIKDPLAMTILLKRINPSKLEALFHPSTYQGKNDTVIPKVPTTIGKRSLEQRDKIVAELLKDPTIPEKVKDRQILVVSGDAHFYGAFVVRNTLTSLGAEVVDGGVGIQPVDALDIADEEGLLDICVSVHNGQGLDYAKQLCQLAKERGKAYRFFMGGKLNAILPGDSEPSDVTDLISEMGIFAIDSVEDFILELAK
ncbi:MAG: hypothetical protein IJO94_08685 [Firmicutes bacterium]|nr:hypothetical protein [Bacillota bacterium]